MSCKSRGFQVLVFLDLSVIVSIPCFPHSHYPPSFVSLPVLETSGVLALFSNSHIPHIIVLGLTDHSLLAFEDVQMSSCHWDLSGHQEKVMSLREDCVPKEGRWKALPPFKCVHSGYWYLGNFIPCFLLNWENFQAFAVQSTHCGALQPWQASLLVTGPCEFTG